MLSVEREYCIHAPARTQMQTRVEQAAEIFAQYGHEIYAVILFHINGTSKADDIYQGLFLTLLTKPIPTDTRNMMAYLYRTVTNDILDYVRREKSYEEKINRYAEGHKSISYTDSPEERAIQEEQMQRLFDLIEKRLPARQAQAIMLRYLDSYSIAEAAKKMGVSRKTISSYVCGGIRKLRQLFYEGKFEPYVC